jgi:hypothetical protein
VITKTQIFFFFSNGLKTWHMVIHTFIFIMSVYNLCVCILRKVVFHSALWWWSYALYMWRYWEIKELTLEPPVNIQDSVSKASAFKYLSLSKTKFWSFLWENCFYKTTSTINQFLMKFWASSFLGRKWFIFLVISVSPPFMNSIIASIYCTNFLFHQSSAFILLSLQSYGLWHFQHHHQNLIRVTIIR